MNLIKTANVENDFPSFKKQPTMWSYVDSDLVDEEKELTDFVEHLKKWSERCNVSSEHDRSETFENMFSELPETIQTILESQYWEDYYGVGQGGSDVIKGNILVDGIRINYQSIVFVNPQRTTKLYENANPEPNIEFNIID